MAASFTGTITGVFNGTGAGSRTLSRTLASFGAVRARRQARDAVWEANRRMRQSLAEKQRVEENATKAVLCCALALVDALMTRRAFAEAQESLVETVRLYREVTKDGEGSETEA